MQSGHPLRLLFSGALGALWIVACSSAPAVVNAPDDGSADSGTLQPDDATTADANSENGDGTPTRRSCTNSFGHGLSAAYGRLDGILVAVVPQSHNGCNGDSSHIHLQILSKSAVYDVAVNTDGLFFETDHTITGGSWSDGWHSPSTLDYPTDLAVHSTSFTQTNAAALLQKFSTANHISVFATGYGPDGAHLVHRNGSNNDGAVVLNPLSATPHLLLFRFSKDSF